MSLGNIDIKTYHHNNRAPTSRIDHIMYLKGQEGSINKSIVLSRADTNTSTLRYSIPKVTNRRYDNKSDEGGGDGICQRIYWDKVDLNKYKERTAYDLQALLKYTGADTSPEILVSRINVILNDAALCASSQPKRKGKRSTNNARVNSKLLPYIFESKKAHWEWKQASRPTGTDSFTLLVMPEMKRQLRQKQRQLEAEKRTQRM